MNRLVHFITILAALLTLFAAPVLADPQPLQQLESGAAPSLSVSCDSYSGSNLNSCKSCTAALGTSITQAQLTSCMACNNTGSGYDATTKSCLQKNPIVKDLNLIVNILAGTASIVVVGVLIAGGIQYALAGNPQAAAAARKRITNALIAFVSFIFIWAFLQWLIPGGL